MTSFFSKEKHLALHNLCFLHKTKKEEEINQSITSSTVLNISMKIFVNEVLETSSSSASSGKL